MRNYASFRGNWPVVLDGFESLRSLHFLPALNKQFTTAKKATWGFSLHICTRFIATELNRRHEAHAVPQARKARVVRRHDLQDASQGLYVVHRSGIIVFATGSPNRVSRLHPAGWRTSRMDRSHLPSLGNVDRWWH